jgi:hypothetical protein
MAMTRLVAIVCCLLALHGQAHANKRVKGTVRKLQTAAASKDAVPTEKTKDSSSPNTQYWDSQDDSSFDNTKAGGSQAVSFDGNKQKDTASKGGSRPFSGDVKLTKEGGGGRSKTSTGDVKVVKEGSGVVSKANKLSSENAATKGGSKDKAKVGGSYGGGSYDESPNVPAGKSKTDPETPGLGTILGLWGAYYFVDMHD